MIRYGETIWYDHMMKYCDDETYIDPYDLFDAEYWAYTNTKEENFDDITAMESEYTCRLMWRPGELWFSKLNGPMQTINNVKDKQAFTEAEELCEKLAKSITIQFKEGIGRVLKFARPHD